MKYNKSQNIYANQILSNIGTCIPMICRYAHNALNNNNSGICTTKLSYVRVPTYLAVYCMSPSMSSFFLVCCCY